MNLPARLCPMLAVASPPFDSPDHLFEIKWDGLRCLAFLNGETRLQSRNLRDLTPGFPELAGLHRAVDGDGVLLDGEIVAFWEGKPSFIRLQRRIHAKTQAGVKAAVREIPAVFVAFDLLYLNGESLLNLPLFERRARMERHVHAGPVIQISRTTPGKGIAFFEAARNLNLEGVVGKKADSPYLPGKRSKLWRKVKAVRKGLFLICGYTVNPAGRRDLSALAVAARIGTGLGFFGLVGAGLDQAEIDKLLGLFQSIRRPGPPQFAWPVEPPTGIRWVEPVYVCEVEYLELTPDLRLRHPLYRGLREDRGPENCRME